MVELDVPSHHDHCAGDIATTVSFSDPVLTTAHTVKAMHLTERRAAANAICAYAGPAGVPNFREYPTPGSSIRRMHIEDVREAVN